jgi:uncharacterized membrane protein YfcA
MIDLPDLLFILAAAFGAGLIDSMVGGGGLIQIPALFAALPNAPHAQLLGTSKLAGVGGTLSAAWRFSRSVDIPWRLALPASAAAFAAAMLGATLTLHIPTAVFRPLVPVMLTVVFIYVAQRKNFGHRHSPRIAGARAIAIAVLGGGVIGLYDGFFGPGTGTFLVFFFVRVFALDFLHASATAKLVNVAANLSALLAFGWTGNVLWLLGAAMMTCNIGGSLLGSYLAIRHGSAFVRRVFLVVVSALIAKTAWDAARGYF